MVLFGVALEMGEVFEDIRTWLKVRRFRKNLEINWIKVLSHTGTLLVLLGVLGEGVSEGIFGIADTRLRKFDENAIATAESKAGDAATSATIAKNAADDALNDLAILESRVSGRQIFDTTPIKALRLKGKVVYVVSGDIEEAKSFCKSISAALHATAGMDAKPSCLSTYAGSETIVRGPSFSESQALAKALTEATHFPFTTAVPPDWNVPNNTLRVFVGPQPSFVIKPKPTNKQSNSHP